MVWCKISMILEFRMMVGSNETEETRRIDYRIQFEIFTKQQALWKKVTNILCEIIFTDVYMSATYVSLKCVFLSIKLVALSCLLQMNTN